MTRRAFLRDAGGLVFLLGAADIAFGAELLAVRVWPAQDYTRVTLESDLPLTAHHSVLHDPERIVIDVQGLELSAALRELIGKVGGDDPYIAAVRLGQNQPRVVRLVIDLKQPVAPQVFALTPVAAYKHRLVFDLYPTEERDPLLALLREHDAPDALGRFIGDIDRSASGAAGGAAPSAAPPIAARQPASDVGAASAPRAASSAAPSTTGAAERAKPSNPRVDRLVIVALDPGHGGEDPGAIGPSGLREKDVVLAVALKLRERLNAEPNVRVMLTRDADYFVPLHDRVRRAQRVQADLFVSIHADAFFTPTAKGASVFALSEKGASSSAARWMAQRENAADGVGGINIRARDATVLRTLLDMSTAAQIKDSLRLGQEVLQRIGQVGPLHRGEVEQAGFAVLKAPDIPSILVETAFISNPTEEARLRDAAYQEKLVSAMLAGIRRYFAKNPPLARQRPL